MGCGCNSGSQQVQMFRVTHNGADRDFLTAQAANKFRADNGIVTPARVVKVNKK